MGTYWKQQKSNLSSLSLSLKRQKPGSLGCMLLAHLIGCQEFRFLFWLGRVEIQWEFLAGLRNWLNIRCGSEQGSSNS